MDLHYDGSMFQAVRITRDGVSLYLHTDERLDLA
jgi:hypothetical protein